MAVNSEMKVPGPFELLKQTLARDFDAYPNASKPLIAQGVRAEDAILAILVARHQFGVIPGTALWKSENVCRPLANTRAVLLEIYALSPTQMDGLSDHVRALTAFGFELEFAIRVADRIHQERVQDQEEIDSGQFGCCESCGAGLEVARRFCKSCGQRVDVAILSDACLRARAVYQALPGRLYRWAWRALTRRADANDTAQVKGDFLSDWLRDFETMGFLPRQPSMPVWVDLTDQEKSSSARFFANPFPKLDTSEIIRRVLNLKSQSPATLRAQFRQAEREMLEREATEKAQKQAQDVKDAETLRRRFFQRLIDSGYSEQDIQAMTSLSEILSALARAPK